MSENPTTAPSSPTPRLVLATGKQREVGGVSTPIASLLGVDVNAVRVGFVLLNVFGGAGLLLYLACWAAIPSPGESESFAERAFHRLRDAPTALQILVGVALVVALARSLDDGGPGIGWGAALLVAGFLLFRQDSQERGLTAAAAPPGPISLSKAGAPGATVSDADRVAADGRLQRAVGLGVITLAEYEQRVAAVYRAETREELDDLTHDLPPAQPQPSLPRRHARVGPGIAVAGLLVLIGGGVLLATVVGDLPLAAGVGGTEASPSSVDDLDEEYRLGLGGIRLDLSDVEDFPTDEPHVLRAGVAVGGIEIVVPADVEVTGEVNVAAGGVRAFGGREGGPATSVDLDEVDQPGDLDGGRLELDIDSGLGGVRIRRAGS